MSTSKLALKNPANGDLILTLDYANGDEIFSLLDKAHQSQMIWKSTTITERQKLIEGVCKYFRNNIETIALEITQQMGKPISQSRSEVFGAINRMEVLTELSPSALAEENLPEIEGFNRSIRHEPLGIVLNIAAWNYPLLIPVNIIAAAILAGNGVMLKHSALTPLCGNVFERAFLSAGAPEYLMNSVIMDHATTEKIIQSGKIDHVAFTGSVNGGHRIHQVAASNFIDTGLELGGKDPAYIREDAVLEVAINNVMDGAFYNAGQSCCAVERIYVHHSRYEEFVYGAIQWLDAQIIGDPIDKSTTMGPLAKQTGIDTLNNQINQAKEYGAIVHPYGGTIPERGQYCRPVILTQVDHSMAIMTDETFGPAVGIMSVVDDVEAIRLMNDSPYGLTASVWTPDSKKAMSIGDQINTGTFFMNRCDHLDPALPWVGVKDSGKGASLSRIGIRNLTRPKSIHLKT